MVIDKLQNEKQTMSQTQCSAPKPKCQPYKGVTTVASKKLNEKIATFSHINGGLLSIPKTFERTSVR